jgi:hypothetical protein
MVSHTIEFRHCYHYCEVLQDPRRESRPAVESQDLLVLFVLRSLSRSLSIRVAGRGLRRAAAEKQRQDGHQTKYVCEICGRE